MSGSTVNTGSSNFGMKTASFTPGPLTPPTEKFVYVVLQRSTQRQRSFDDELHIRLVVATEDLAAATILQDITEFHALSTAAGHTVHGMMTLDEIKSRKMAHMYCSERPSDKQDDSLDTQNSEDEQFQWGAFDEMRTWWYQRKLLVEPEAGVDTVREGDGSGSGDRMDFDLEGTGGRGGAHLDLRPIQDAARLDFGMSSGR
jgi:hypothetical protein